MGCVCEWRDLAYVVDEAEQMLLSAAADEMGAAGIATW